ncbi:MAG: glutathione peroxidase [Clostridiales bacterium]|jgi:glutathione peroxidase|nr:glutathione peroxidase [Clostridiales bacterium]MDN5300137.1 glutathione peroxidase [Clostridiales bacterium]
MSLYDLDATTIEGENITLSNYKGKVLIIVNTASKCGFTPQYEDLEKLYQKYQAQGLEILGFPSNQFAEQEPGTNDEVKSFCLLNYGVSFPLFAKTDVRGSQAHPVFKYLTAEKGFEGFGKFNPTGKMLSAMLKLKYPEIMPGDGIKWNFTKFLIDREGNVIKRFEPTVSPLDMEDELKQLL